MRCPKCGAEHRMVRRVAAGTGGKVGRVRFCGQCGAEFETVEVPVLEVERELLQAALWRVLMDSRMDSRQEHAGMTGDQEHAGMTGDQEHAGMTEVDGG